MMNHTSAVKNGLLTKIGIVIVWIALIWMIMYVPSFISSRLSKRTLNIFTWPGILDPKVLSDFEKKVGVKINLSYFDSNDELIVKLRATQGAGYDIIIPSDYAVDVLKKENLLKKIDQTKLNIIKDINPHLLNHYFDPANEYSIPYEWSVFGFGFDKNFFQNNKPDSWADVFDADRINYKLVMPNDALLSIPFASFYLFNDIQSIDRSRLSEIQQLLFKQRSWVLAYIDARADYLLSTKNCPLVVSSSSYIARSMLTNNYVDFSIPKEGTILTIESIAMTQASDKDDLVYQFLNFLYDPFVIKKQFASHLFFPALKTSYDRLEAPENIKRLIQLEEREFKKFSFFKLNTLQDGLTEQDIQYAWMSVKR